MFLYLITFTKLRILIVWFVLNLVRKVFSLPESMATTGANAKSKQLLSKEQLISGFNELRQQQRMLASRMSEIEMDMKEHE